MALSVNTTITRMMDEPDFPVIVHAKQNDKRTRFVTLRCSDTENGFSIPSGTVGIVRVRKNDGTACFYDKNDLGDAAVVIDGNSVTIELVEQALTAAGMQKAEVNLYTPDGAKITTFSFALEVEASVLTDAQIVSSDYYNVLTSDISSALAAARCCGRFGRRSSCAGGRGSSVRGSCSSKQSRSCGQCCGCGRQ